MAVTQNTDVQTTIETRVSELLTETLVQESVMLGNVQDRTNEVGPGMDRLSVNVLNNLGVQNVNLDGTAVTPGTITSTEAELVLDQFKTYAFSIGDKTAVQSKIQLVQEQLQIGAREHAAAIDDFLIALGIAGVSQSGPDHLIALDGSDALVDLRTAKRLLDLQNVPKRDRKWLASPGWMEKLFSSNNIIRANEFGSRDAIASASVARIYDFDIIESSSAELPDNGFMAYYMPTIQFARQIQPRFKREEKILEHREDYSLSQLYGGQVSPDGARRIVVGDADGVSPIA